MAARNRKTSMSKPCYIPSTPHEAESDAGAGSSQSSHGVGGQVGEANDGDNVPHTRNGVLSTGSSAVGTDVMATQPSSSGLVRDVIGIFVVAFDTKEGNLLEWCVPQELPLEGVEFRALISGAHTITSDFIYFRQGDYFGAACYEKLTVLSEIERGARMKSVGVIVANYDTLHHHLEYLAQQVRRKEKVTLQRRGIVVSPHMNVHMHRAYKLHICQSIWSHKPITLYRNHRDPIIVSI
ncbi:uncharacterized protein LOC134782115 [Penaeus indicus]|uniref:uncharacterized protein LOC134782115 n=1 Tax=Penaeus indicus TaxID=29960 RepID=UPI00300C0947